MEPNCNNELYDKLKNLNDSQIGKDFRGSIPYRLRDLMVYYMLNKGSIYKKRYYSNKFVNNIIMIIDTKQMKEDPLHSNFYVDLVDYLNKFFAWNMEYQVFMEHFKVVRDLFSSISLDLRKIFYDLFLKKNKMVFNKRIYFLLIYVLNEVRQFRWAFIQIFDSLLEYAKCKSTFIYVKIVLDF